MPKVTSRKRAPPELDLTKIVFPNQCFVVVLFCPVAGGQQGYTWKTEKTMENDGHVELLHPGDTVGATPLLRAKSVSLKSVSLPLSRPVPWTVDIGRRSHNMPPGDAPGQKFVPLPQTPNQFSSSSRHLLIPNARQRLSLEAGRVCYRKDLRICTETPR